MEKKEIPIAILMLVASLILVIPAISAAALTTTWNTLGGVSNYSNLTTSFSFNCTTSAHRVTNVTVYANTTAGSMNPLESFANTTGVSQTAWTGTVDIQAADDGSNQNLTCKAQNATVTAYSDQRTASHIRLDSTAPQCNVSVSKSTVAYQGLQKVTYFSSDNLARRLTTVDVNGPGQQSTITVTAQNGPIELASNDTKYVGSWTANMTVTDWSGNSCTGTTTFKTYAGEAVQGEVPEAPAQGKDNTLLLIIGAVVVLWLLFGRKK